MTKISIITACLNNAATIEDTVKSVLGQDYPGVEFIVVDGASADGTLDILNRYRDRITALISEKDEGIYYALNKGLKMATGEIAGLLHADDFYNGADILSKVMKAFESAGTDCVYGDLQYVQRDKTGKVLRNWIAGEYNDGLFLKGWMPPHPSFFIRRACYEKYGFFNTDLSISADYELMLRMIHKYKLSTRYLPEVLVKMRAGGKSNKSLANRIKANAEDRKAWKMNDLQPSPLTLIRKPLGKLKQFFG